MPTAAEGDSVTVHIINGKCQFSQNLLFIHSRIKRHTKKKHFGRTETSERQLIANK